MNIRLHRIRSVIPQTEEVKKENNNFINDINDELFTENIVLTENADYDDIDAVFVESGGSEESFLKIFHSLKSPVILLSTQKYNSLPACYEIKSFLCSKKINSLILFGDLKNIALNISRLARVYEAKREIFNSRLGVIGKPSDWLIYSQVDYSKVYEKFGINLIDISTEQFDAEIDKKTYRNVKHIDELKRKCKDEKTLKEALCIYGALKRLIIHYNLDGLTVRCFDLLDKYKNTSCLALALLNEEGYVATCEGDIPSMLTMFLLNRLHDYSSFQANPSYIFLDKKQVLFAHCTVPLDMCQSFSLDTHFESGLGIGIKGELDLGRCAVYKIGADLSDFAAYEGTIVKNENMKGYCRTQVIIEFEENDFFSFIGSEVGNHFIISYQNDLTDFYTLMSLYQISESR